MKPITEFNKQNLDALRNDINSALAKVFAEYGIAGSIGNIRYSSYEISTKLTVNVVNPKAAKEIFAKEANMGRMYGITASIGTVIHDRGRRLEYIGIAPSRRKYPIKFRQADGKVILFTTHIVDQLNKASK